MFIKEKIKPESVHKICSPKTYIATAEIYPTFTRRIEENENIDEWELGEYSVFWTVYSQTDEIKCTSVETVSTLSSNNYYGFKWRKIV